MQAQLMEDGNDQAKASPYSILLKQISYAGGLHRKHSSFGDGAQRIPFMNSPDGKDTQSAIYSPYTHSIGLDGNADSVKPSLESVCKHAGQLCTASVDPGATLRQHTPGLPERMCSAGMLRLHGA